MAKRTETVYDGSSECTDCKTLLTPIETMYGYDRPRCPDCRNNKNSTLLKNRMSEK